MAAKTAGRKLRRGAALLFTVGLLALVGWQLPFILQHWAAFVIIFFVGALLFFFIRFERSALSSREVGVIAILAALAAISRVPFAALPGIQPTTFITIISGYVFGAQAGFMVGAVAALGSNFFLGQGPWTLFQMLFWGLAGAGAGVLGRYFPRTGRAGMALFNGFWGFLFGWLMNLYLVVFLIKPLTWSSVLTAYSASLPFDCFHALGNVAFSVLLGPQLVRVLRRFKAKMTYVEG